MASQTIDDYEPSNQVFRELLKMFNTSAPPDLRKPVIGAIREMDVELTQHINKQNELIARLIACLEEPIENSDDLSAAGRYLIVTTNKLRFEYIKQQIRMEYSTTIERMIARGDSIREWGAPSGPTFDAINHLINQSPGPRNILSRFNTQTPEYTPLWSIQRNARRYRAMFSGGDQARKQYFNTYAAIVFGDTLLGYMRDQAAAITSALQSVPPPAEVVDYETAFQRARVDWLLSHQDATEVLIAILVKYAESIMRFLSDVS